MEKIHCNGEKVFIGIDVHKRQYTVNCRLAGKVVGRCTMPAYPSVLIDFVSKHLIGAKIHTAYEAGFSGFGLHRALISAGIDSTVVHPLSIEVDQKKVKTDKRDSARIAEQLEAGRLKCIRIPSEEQEIKRVLTRTREQLVRARTRAGNQIQMRRLQFGLVDPMDRTRMGPATILKVLSLDVAPELKLSFSVLAGVWRCVNSQIALLDRELVKVSSGDGLWQAYKRVSGVGKLTARILADELGDMSQFPNERKLFSFLGLTPSEHSTGDKRHLGSITKQGSSRLRHILVEAAWVAVKKDTALRTDFLRIAARAGKRKAIVAIARKLANKIRAALRKKEDYSLNYKTAA